MSEFQPYHQSRPYSPPSSGVEVVRPDVDPPREPGPADLFRAMADRIERNDPEEFSGAILIVPPPSQDNPADPVEILIIDPHHDEGHFWGVCKAKVDIEHGRWQEVRSIPRPGAYR